MHSSLHNYHGNAAHVAENKAALVTGSGGNGEALDVLVIKHSLYIRLFSVIAQSRAEDKCYLGGKVDLFLEALVAF